MKEEVLRQDLLILCGSGAVFGQGFCLGNAVFGQGFCLDGIICGRFFGLSGSAGSGRFCLISAGAKGAKQEKSSSQDHNCKNSKDRFTAFLFGTAAADLIDSGKNHGIYVIGILADIVKLVCLANRAEAGRQVGRDLRTLDHNGDDREPPFQRSFNLQADIVPGVIAAVKGSIRDQQQKNVAFVHFRQYNLIKIAGFDRLDVEKAFIFPVFELSANGFCKLEGSIAPVTDEYFMFHIYHFSL